MRFDGFTRLVVMDAHARQERGDLAGAWDGIVAIFRMARHISTGGDHVSNLTALTLVERQALGLAMDWAVDFRQTPERLDKALAAFGALPKIPHVTDKIRAEARFIENTLDLPSRGFATG